MEKRKYENDEINSFDDFNTSNLNEKIDINKIKEKVNAQNINKDKEKKINKDEVPSKVETPKETETSKKSEETGEIKEVKKEKDEKKENLHNLKEPIIRLENIGLKYGSEVVLKDVNININQKEFVYLVGESGAGKSSVAKMLYKEIEPTKGHIYIQGEDITKYKSRQLPKLRRKIGVIFQDYKLLSDKTIYENVAFSLRVTGYPGSKIRPKVEEVLKKVGILEQAQKYPDELSGGQQQRAAIARAIVDNPIIIVADEPTGNLDPENALAIMELLEKINKEGTTIVMATHDVGIVNNFLNRVILLGDGKVLKEAQGEYIYE